MENSFLSEFKERNYFNQCTNSVELEQVMNNKKIKRSQKTTKTNKIYPKKNNNFSR